ncbi:MAG TPA: pentapeptide repeat-containing protein, partial [Sphingomicrobium sp.]|nr:pentapeptide repeat-containing protein [Sphingomicrobium sp.]
YFCDFRNTSLTSSAGKPPFENSKLFGCRFDGATFTEANLSNVSVRWCSFWGAKLIESHLPEGVFKALQKASCITLIENGTASYEVLTLGDILWRPTATRLWLLLRFICGSSFRGSAAL